MRVLVTGIAGFAGSHLAEYLLNQADVVVAGVIRPNSDLRHIESITSQLTLYRGDVSDYLFLEKTVAEWQPAFVFHLAAQAAPSLSWKHAQETLTVNVLGQYNLLEAVAQVCPAARVLVVGSAYEYGMVAPTEIPVNEQAPLRPGSPYAVSKIAQDMLGYQFFINGRLHTVRVRPFNHIGPRQSTEFVAASFACQIAEIEAGLRPPVIDVGNLETKRDFSDVRDVVRAYWLALAHGKPGDVYNLGSGRSHSIGFILQTLLGQSNTNIVVQQDQSRLRPSDIPDLVCDPAKFRGLTGWQTTIPLEQSVADVLAYWRRRVSGSSSR